MKLLKRKFGIRRKNLYNSILDMPMYNWIKMRQESDFSFLLRDKKKHRSNISDNHSEQLKDVYLDLLTEFFDNFGQSKSFKNEIELKIKITDLNTEYACTGDAFILNEIDMLNQKLLKIQADNIDKNLGVNEKDEVLLQIKRVGSSLGKPVDIRAISVFQFYVQLRNDQLSLN